MKSTGIVRRLDDLGRIVIPREIRGRLGLKENDAIEFFAEDNKLILVKYDVVNDIAAAIENVYDVVNNNQRMGSLSDDVSEAVVRKLDEAKALLNSQRKEKNQ